MIVAFLGGLAWIVYALRSRYQDDADPAAERDQMLCQFRELQRQGQITDDEYRNIRSQLVERNAGIPKHGLPTSDRTEAELSAAADVSRQAGNGKAQSESSSPDGDSE